MLPEEMEYQRSGAAGAWHALHTRHQHEKLVAELLSRQGFEVFLPLYTAVHRWKDRAKRLRLPLFPCYLFLRDGAGRRLEVLKTPGVHGMVEVAGRPGVIPEEEIAAIRRLVAAPLPIEPHPYLESGDRVRIKAGALEGLEGILVRRQDQWRLVLSIEMLGRAVAVQVDAFLVERVGPRKKSAPATRFVGNFAPLRHSPGVAAAGLP
ncbi:MAG TPA: UpxY family transcription antiterminator [Terriglobia bacterium]|nr:UpxY family transcription antiterminator [Terriglobia bacterium]